MNNYETYILNQFDFSDEAGRCYSVKELAAHIKDYVEQYIEKDISKPRDGFVIDILNVAMSHINWHEIAEYYEEYLLKEEEHD